MRVLFVSTYPHWPDIRGGLQTTTHDLCIALQMAGAEVAVLCGQFEHLQADPVGPPSRTGSDLGYLTVRALDPAAMLESVAAAWDASVIVVQSGTVLVPLIRASVGTGRPTAVYLHNVEPEQIGGALLPLPELLYFANSQFTARRMAALYGIHSTVVLPVVAPERYLAGARGDKVLFVNPVPLKGVQMLFALAALCPDLTFLVVESWHIDPAWRDLSKERAEALGNIEWLSPTNDMREVYKQARMLLMPSVWEEAFGRTVVEAQLNGLPVLASNRGALPEVVGEGGLTLDPHGDLADWIAALRRLYIDEGEVFGDAAVKNALGHVAATPLIVADLMEQLAAHAAR